VNDIDRGNNRRTSISPVEVKLTPPPNLVVENIIGPESTFSGEFSVGTIEVQNSQVCTVFMRFLMLYQYMCHFACISPLRQDFTLVASQSPQESKKGNLVCVKSITFLCFSMTTRSSTDWSAHIASCHSTEFLELTLHVFVNVGKIAVPSSNLSTLPHS